MPEKIPKISYFEKPSIVFVDTDYSMIPEVRKIDKIENLSNKI